MDKNLIDISYGVTDRAPRGWAAILDHCTAILHSYTAILDGHAAILDRHAATRDLKPRSSIVMPILTLQSAIITAIFDRPESVVI